MQRPVIRQSVPSEVDQDIWTPQLIESSRSRRGNVEFHDTHRPRYRLQTTRIARYRHYFMRFRPKVSKNVASDVAARPRDRNFHVRSLCSEHLQRWDRRHKTPPPSPHIV